MWQYRMTGDITIQLSGGLFLEKRRLFLPWGARFDQLLATGVPTLDQECHRCRLYWKDEAILEGLQGHLSATLSPAKDTAGLQQVRFEPCQSRISGDPWQGLEPELVHLRQAFGPPTGLKAWQGYLWLLPGLEVELGFYDSGPFYEDDDLHKWVHIRRVA